MSPVGIRARSVTVGRRSVKSILQDYWALCAFLELRGSGPGEGFSHNLKLLAKSVSLHDG